MIRFEHEGASVLSGRAGAVSVTRKFSEDVADEIAGSANDE
jgi:hypothetical protein